MHGTMSLKHPSLVLRSSCLPEKVGVNKKYSPSKIRGYLTEGSQPKSVKPTTRERKLRNDVNWKGALKRKRVQQTGVNFKSICPGQWLIFKP